ncbi:MAG: flagellar motor switch protein FliG [Novosphingobium sp.]|uniref:flagellar motor switch protein FliG n=1 Tax=Novosphingobium sp. TaxID=1874826 RepID=UPI001DE28980|nr:flagellar motor switch protein FliG [Novosphingobium sp.]MCB2057937.1 flagellar motor switch protein FliG [Novosphingobium sp.]MCP5385644.1 flagellar motor switch protein FliG [Novosphingobium sp.]
MIAVSHALLADAERAAVMIMLLEEEQAAAILGQLGPDELQVLGEKMCALGDIGPEQITQAIAGFVRSTDHQGISARGRNRKVRSLMNRAIGPVKADSLMQRILPEGEDRGPAIELARWLTPQALIPLIRDEHPQAVAVLLVQLDPEVAAQVLHSLPAEQQTQVVHRIATLGPVSREAVVMLEQLLESRIAESHGRDMLLLGGMREAAEIINNAGKAAEKRIMPELGRIDKALARRIENEMFKFEHLFALDPQAMGALLREVESEVLIDALKGTAEEHREAFFRAMSSRAADGVKDEIASRGRLKMAEVVEAQRTIIAIARRLAGEGVIQFGGGGDDEYV